MRVEVDHRDPALAEVLRNSGGVRPGNRMVTAENQRHSPGGGHGVHSLLQITHRPRRVTREHLDVACVVDPQILQAVDPHRQRRSRPVVWQVARLADVLRTEPRSGAMRGAPVERRPDDHDVGVGVGGDVGPVTPVDAEERDVGPELRSVPSHVVT